MQQPRPHTVPPRRPSTLGPLLSTLSRRGALTCLLGLAAVRVWTQGVMFDSYRQSDGGAFSLLASLVYSAVYLAVALLAFRRPPNARTLGWVAFAALVGAPLSLVAWSSFGGPALFGLSVVLAGLGAGFGGVMWIVPYCRLSPREAILYTFASMGATAVGGFVLGFVPQPQGLWVCVFLAPVVLLSYQKALRVCETPATEPAGRTARPSHTALAVVLGGTAVFGLMLGVSRGYPLGTPVSFDLPLRVVHQLGALLLSLFVLAWTLGGNHDLRFSFLWRIEIAVAACAMLLLVSFPSNEGALALGVAVANIANSFMAAVMWITVIELSRASSLHPYTVCGLTWCVRGVSRDLGRVAIIALAATPHALTVGVGVAVAALAVSMAVLLSDNLFTTGAAQGTRAAKKEPPTKTVAAPEGDPNAIAALFQQSAARVGERYGLTERETEVAALIARGHSKTHIAELLGLKESTVRSHTKSIYTKLGIQSREQLMGIFEQEKI